MKRLLLIFFLLLSIAAGAKAALLGNVQTEVQQTATVPITDTLTGTFYNDEIGLRLHVDLGNERLTIPNMAFLGPVYAYMDGKIYGVWMLIKKEVRKGKAYLRFTNDIGSDSQTIELSQTSDGNYYYRTIDGNNVKKVVGRRLVKIADAMPMKRKPLEQ